MIAFLAVPHVVRGQEGKWSPTIYGFEGELDFGGVYQQHKNLTAGKGTETTDLYFLEKIVLSATGYVYHPRFLIFLGKLGGGLSQERFESSNPGAGSSGQGGGWRNTPLWEYELRGLLLPEHPYNLELFALRQNPFIPGNTTWGVAPVTMTEGALFTYKDMPWTFRLGDTLNSIDYTTSKVDTNNFHANGAYSVENFLLAAAVSRTDSDSTVNAAVSDYTTTRYAAQNQIRLFDRKFFLTSDVNQVSLESNQPTSSLNGDRFNWNENLSVFLPYNFTAAANYNYFKDTENTATPFSGAARNFTSTTNSAGFSLTHRLYESLQSSYIYNDSSTTTTTGDSSSTSQSLNAIYTKKIRWGVLRAGGYLSWMTTEQESAPAVINEVHSARIFDEFTLAQTKIDEASILIRVKDRFTGTYFDMQGGVDYTVIPVADTTRIRILSVPPPVLNPDPLYVYEFTAEYLYAPANFKLKTNGEGYFVRLELFGGYFIPYYNFDHLDQKVLSGSLPGGPEDMTTRTVGVALERPPYFAVVEYLDRQSRYNPQEKYRAEASYYKEVNPRTNLNLRAYYTRTEYFQGVFQPAGPPETRVGGDLSVRNTFPSINLVSNFSASYAQTHWQYDTDFYSINEVLTWSREKIEVSFQATLSVSESTLQNGKQETLYDRFLLMVKRKLF